MSLSIYTHWSCCGYSPYQTIFFLVLHHLLYTFLLFKNLLVLTLKKQKVEMEGKGKVGSSSSSSFTNQLFGPKEPSSSSNFSSIFPPPSKVLLLFLSLLLFYSCFCCLFWLVLEFYSSRFQGTTGNMILSSKHGSLGQWKSRSPTVFVLRTVYLNLRRLVSLLESIWFLFLYIKPSFVRKPSDSFLNQEFSKLLHFSWN